MCVDGTDRASLSVDRDHRRDTYRIISSSHLIIQDIICRLHLHIFICSRIDVTGTASRRYTHPPGDGTKDSQGHTHGVERPARSDAREGNPDSRHVAPITSRVPHDTNAAARLRPWYHPSSSIGWSADRIARSPSSSAAAARLHLRHPHLSRFRCDSRSCKSRRRSMVYRQPRTPVSYQDLSFHESWPAPSSRHVSISAPSGILAHTHTHAFSCVLLSTSPELAMCLPRSLFFSDAVSLDVS